MLRDYVWLKQCRPVVRWIKRGTILLTAEDVTGDRGYKLDRPRSNSPNTAKKIHPPLSLLVIQSWNPHSCNSSSKSDRNTAGRARNSGWSVVSNLDASLTAGIMLARGALSVWATWQAGTSTMHEESDSSNSAVSSWFTSLDLQDFS